MSNPTYDLEETSCKSASSTTIEILQTRVEADGKLRNGMQVQVGDDTFVSAELHLRSEERHEHGDILTWVTTNADGDEFSSVDVHAREESSWPESDRDVRANGARESRACAALNLGKTKAQIECEQRASTGETPTPGQPKCGDL